MSDPSSGGTSSQPSPSGSQGQRTTGASSPALSFKDRIRANAASPKYGSPASAPLDTAPPSSSSTAPTPLVRSPPQLELAPCVGPSGLGVLTRPRSDSAEAQRRSADNDRDAHRSRASSGSSCSGRDSNSHAVCAANAASVRPGSPPPALQAAQGVSPPLPSPAAADCDEEEPLTPMALTPGDGSVTPQRGKKREKLFSPPLVSPSAGAGPSASAHPEQHQQQPPRVGGGLPPALSLHPTSSLSQSREASEKRRSTYSALLVPSTPVRDRRSLLGAVSFSAFDLHASVGADDALSNASEPPAGHAPTFSTMYAMHEFAESPMFVLQCERESAGIDPALRIASFQTLSFDDEYGRYAGGPSAQDDEEGACGCSEATITKDMRGFDYSKYQTPQLFHSCFVCRRRPATFLCLQTFDAVCASHVEQYFQRKNKLYRDERTAKAEGREVDHGKNNGNQIISSVAPQCALFINLLDIATSYDRIFWCEQCHRFTWKHTDVYEPLTDQLVFSRGTYLPAPILDVHVRQYSTKLRAQATAAGARPDSLGSSSSSMSLVPLVAGHCEDAGAPLPPRRLAALGASVQGWRSGQEDAEAAFALPLWGREVAAVFCVFDGHGGEAVARLAAQSIEQFTRAATASRISPVGAPPMELDAVQSLFTDIFTAAFVALDEHIQSTPEGLQGDYNCVGCTACVVAVTAQHIVCANVGDSGAAVHSRRDGTLKMLSVPHRITGEVEVRRIKAAGYSIVNERIEGMLAVPRAIGDYDFKQAGAKSRTEQAVSPAPDVSTIALPPSGSDWRIVMACDGVWDTITVAEAERAIESGFAAAATPPNLLAGARELPAVEETLSARVLDSQLLSVALTLMECCVSPFDDPEGNGMDNVSVLIAEPLYDF